MSVQMSRVGGKADIMCSIRALPVVTQIGSRAGLDEKAALMHPPCSLNTRMVAMNSGVVRFSMIAAMLMLATFGTTRAEEAAKLAVTAPVLSNTGPDAAAYGADEGFPLGTLATASQMRHLVASYSHFDELTPARIVPRAASPWSFQRAAEPDISYTFGGEPRTIKDYLNRQPTTGLLIARDDTILYEHYQYARSERDRFLSQSMASLYRSKKAKQPIQIADLTAEPVYFERDRNRVALVELGGYRAILSVPMVKESEVIGAINMYRQDAGTFSDNHVELLQNK
jgi:GAF domain